VDSKKYLTNKNFCPIPWTGFMYNSDGTVQNCIRNREPIGNLKQNSLKEILERNTEIKQNMLDNKPGNGCHGCYQLEQGKKSFDIVSDRIFYLKELREVPLDTYSDVDNFDLHKIDIRWSNSCNFGCVYCGPEYSSRWVAELKLEKQQVPEDRVNELKEFVFSNVDTLKHVYLAGGEPLLMKENIEILELLLKRNPEVNLRVNTNLSKTGTPVFDLICKFKNVHWTLSVESMEDEFEYIRHGGKWQDFLDNLEVIRSLEHKVSFNMLWIPLNYLSIFECIKYLQQQGFHNNSFIVNAIENPQAFDIRNMPDIILEKLKDKLLYELAKAPGYLLENSYSNMLLFLKKPFEKNPELMLNYIKRIDQLRGLKSKEVFMEFYKCLRK
jgi:MoaA/NifB/PqqE/SkfB family radical SAM enzyme